MSITPFPDRMFAVGVEPTGVRVNTYQKMSIIHDLTLALEPEELAYIKRSPLGNIFDLVNHPSCSATFGIYLLSRQLDIKKEYEIWILFAGTPIRFSLREFKLVTGLNCSKFPAEKKLKKKRPYYKNLFSLSDSKDTVLVDKVLQKLRSRRVKDFYIRVRFAALILVDAILLPTQHYPKLKIDKDHAEMSEDLTYFLNFPWGRCSFERIISSLKERDLRQFQECNISVQGLFIALQMVVLQAVPAIQDGSPSLAEVCEDLDEDEAPVGLQRISVKLNLAKTLDAAAEVKVFPIISPEIEFNSYEEDLGWSDEEDDPLVDNLVRLATEGFIFEEEMFVGGYDSSRPQIPPTKPPLKKNARRKQEQIKTSLPRTNKRTKCMKDAGMDVLESSSTPCLINLDQMEAMIRRVVKELLEENNTINNPMLFGSFVNGFNNNATLSPAEQQCPAAFKGDGADISPFKSSSTKSSSKSDMHSPSATEPPLPTSVGEQTDQNKCLYVGAGVHGVSNGGGVVGAEDLLGDGVPHSE